MRLQEFWYSLPPHLIAQTPLENRQDSRLLVFDRTRLTISHSFFKNIIDFLVPGDIMVVNITKVDPVRLFAKKKTGGKVEVLLLKKKAETEWEVLIGGKHVRQGSMLFFVEGLFAAVVEELSDGQRILQFNCAVEPYLSKIGNVPLPPYIHTQLSNPERYQTVYAKTSGSAAAPTAGLHFTEELMRDLISYGIEFVEIILHIGLDTFLPVTEEMVEKHRIHREWCHVPDESARKINAAIKSNRRVIAVGSTSVRTLESAARNGLVVSFTGETDLFIIPGYSFKIVKAMITNFHLPKSTLLMMVSAFAGRENIMECYQEAIHREYRFYSFGDAMLIM